MTLGGFLFFYVILCIVFPEVLLMTFAFLLLIGEFILRLFGKSFDDKPKT